VPGDECKKDHTDVEKYVDAHLRCHNSSFYGYGILLDEAQRKVQCISVRFWAFIKFAS
jgi:hypothetical protein